MTKIDRAKLEIQRLIDLKLRKLKIRQIEFFFDLFFFRFSEKNIPETNTESLYVFYH